MPVPNRPVKPRKAKHIDKPIMAIDREQVLLESGEVHPYSDLPSLVKFLPSSIVVAHHPGQLIQFLDTHFQDDPLWQFRLTPVQRSSWSPERERKTVTKDCIVGYFGFKGERKQAGHYHYPLSPHTYCLKSINELRKTVPGEIATIHKLMEWGIELRAFLQKHKLNLSPTAGGIAAQLLRDEKFYPSPRRKAPGHTNVKVREHLPGNYYRLYGAAEGTKSYNAAYLDQSSAHHKIASEIDFPCVNSLRRHGRYSTLEDRSFAKYGTKKYDEFITQHGLFYLAFEVPRFFSGDFPLPACDFKTGYGRGYFYSNELAYLQRSGVRIRHIIGCWTSEGVDRGINRYARWALEQLDNAESIAKPWLKPTLLATYGVLASKPRKLEFGYKHAKNSEPKKYPCGSGFIEVEARSTLKEREPLIANVIHRGMIEAETRLRSLEYAKELASDGYNVLAVYADSVFVESNKDLPLIKPGWRLQEYLTRLRFQSSTHFTSAEISKTPGVPARFRDRAKLPPRPKRKVKNG